MLRSVELRMHEKNVISKELVETRGNCLNGLCIFYLFLCAFVVAWVFIICRHKRYGVSSNRQIQKFLDEIVATSIFIPHFKIQYDIFLVSSYIAALAFIRHKIYSKCEKKPQKFFNFFASCFQLNTHKITFMTICQILLRKVFTHLIKYMKIWWLYQDRDVQLFAAVLCRNSLHLRSFYSCSSNENLGQIK